MDGGQATVYAAGLAASVTLLGAAIAYKAGRRQVRDQAAVEHERWLRGQREQAYVDFLGACERATEAVHQCRGQADELHGRLVRREIQIGQGEPVSMDEGWRLHDATQQLLNRILMLGPDAVIERAEATQSAIFNFCMAVQGVSQQLMLRPVEQVELDLASDKMSEVYGARGEFSVAARRVLTGGANTVAE
ncbi:hypothetical protein AB0E78_38535 [Streptomyces sp. NPDC032198]|uniref:hypothetical protein n=1 Tax=Streptomyces sp. NPDC032198 TaxID=3155127 RepID=UPI0033C40618